MECKGTITALVTPFKGESLDLEGLKENIDFQIENEIDGLVILGTTGEAFLLSTEEWEKTLFTAVETVGGRVPLFAGTGDISTKNALEKTRKAKKFGADGALLITPFYTKPTQQGILHHYRTIAEAVDFPIMIDDNFSRTGVRLEVKTLLQFAEIPQVIGVKGSSAEIFFHQEALHALSSLKETFSYVSGDDLLTFSLLSLGGDGVISVLSNLLPQEIKKLVDTMRAGDLKKGQEIYEELFPFFKGAACEVNPIAIKAMMRLKKMPAGKCRLPLTPIGKENENMLATLLAEKAMIAGYG